MKMKLIHISKFYFLGLLIICGELSYSQRKNIVVSDDLNNSAEMLKVKMGTMWMGRIWNFKFGDYAVVKKSKMSPRVSKQKSNILGTKSEYKSGYKFNFVLSEKAIDSAIVSAVYSKNVKEVHSMELFPNIYFGREEVLKDSINFTADISLSSNRDKNWKLFLLITSGSETEFKNEGALIYGDRVILINLVSSNLNGNDKRWFPALGYEFVENDKAICAVQYFGGGSFGLNKNIIWIDSKLNQKMKLILAATMTAILQVKSPGG